MPDFSSPVYLPHIDLRRLVACINSCEVFGLRSLFPGCKEWRLIMPTIKSPAIGEPPGALQASIRLV